MKLLIVTSKKEFRSKEFKKINDYIVNKGLGKKVYWFVASLHCSFCKKSYLKIFKKKIEQARNKFDKIIGSTNLKTYRKIFLKNNLEIYNLKKLSKMFAQQLN
jgi:hypothetical protein